MDDGEVLTGRSGSRVGGYPCIENCYATSIAIDFSMMNVFFFFGFRCSLRTHDRVIFLENDFKKCPSGKSRHIKEKEFGLLIFVSFWIIPNGGGGGESFPIFCAKQLPIQQRHHHHQSRPFAGRALCCVLYTACMKKRKKNLGSVFSWPTCPCIPTHT
jgi:hypothetical protein